MRFLFKVSSRHFSNAVIADIEHVFVHWKGSHEAVLKINCCVSIKQDSYGHHVKVATLDINVNVLTVPLYFKMFQNVMETLKHCSECSLHLRS